MKNVTRQAGGYVLSSLRSERSPAQLVVVAAVLFGIFAALDPGVFPSLSNLQAMGFQLPPEGLLGLAIMFSMVMGGIDLSIVAVADLAGVVAVEFYGAVHSRSGLSILAGGLIALAVGLACGAVNGFVIGKIGVTPILATLCTMDIYGGLATGVTKGVALLYVPSGLLTLGDGTVAGIPVPMLVFVALAIGCGYLLSGTRAGFKLRLSGTNPRAAALSGISQPRAQVLTYVVSGGLAAVAGVMFVAVEDSATPDYGQSYLLLGVVIAVFGGAALNGGFASVTGTALAAVSLVIVASGTVLLQINQYLYEAIQGALVIGVMVARQAFQSGGITRTPGTPGVDEAGTRAGLSDVTTVPEVGATLD